MTLLLLFVIMEGLVGGVSVANAVATSTTVSSASTNKEAANLRASDVEWFIFSPVSA